MLDYSAAPSDSGAEAVVISTIKMGSSGIPIPAVEGSPSTEENGMSDIAWGSRR